MPIPLPPIADDDPSEFLYKRQGPWPQPSPAHPQGEAPAVLHIPWAEQADWFFNIGLRYLRQLGFGWPSALWYTITHRSIVEVSDPVFVDMLTTTVFSRFLRQPLDAVDNTAFAAVMAAAPPGATWYKSDFSAMGYVQPYAGMYVAPTVVLVRKDSAGAFHVDAINVNGVVITPANADAWRLARCYVLQGCVHRLIISIHPILHFPMDSVNAITKTSLPMRHILYKLLIPHLRFSLVLDNTVLENYFSILNNFKWQLYGCFAGPVNGLRDLIVAGWQGIPGNSSYPRYDWTLQKPDIPTPYGAFLQKYWDCIYSFVQPVVSQIQGNDVEYVQRWAKYIRSYIKDFPKPGAIIQGNTLAETVTTMIWDIAVAHGTDHYNYTQMDMNQMPMRMRVPPPTSPNASPPDPRDFSSFMDIFKYRMAWNMFFKPTNVTLLQDTWYNFGDPGLDNLNRKFLQDLRTLDQSLPPNQRYCPLDQMARGVQY